MPPIPDSIEMTLLGLTADKPSLGSPTVVNDLLRGLLKLVTELRAEQLQGRRQDILGPIQDEVRRLQDVFYGRDIRYAMTPWFSEKHLGRALVEGAGMEGEAADAVERLLLRMVSEFLDIYLPFENDELPEQELPWRIDALVEFYQAAVMGLPYDQDDET